MQQPQSTVTTITNANTNSANANATANVGVSSAPRMASSSSASFTNSAQAERDRIVQRDGTACVAPRGGGNNVSIAFSHCQCQANMSSLTSLDDNAILALPSLQAPLVSAETLDDETDLREAGRKINSLEKQCKKLMEDLANERRERAAVEVELKRVQDDNQKATALLCKYADWFFNVAEPQLESVSVTPLPTNGNGNGPNHASAFLFGTTVARSTNTTTDLL